MPARYMVPTLVVALLAIVPALTSPPPEPAAAAPPAASAAVPEEALRALEQGRFWRASRILGEYLAAEGDSTPGTILLAARAEAGWSHWQRVRGLLRARPWLDSYADGAGRELLARSHLALEEWELAVQELSAYLDGRRGLSPRVEGVAELRLAAALLGADRTAEALEAYDRAAEQLPHLRDWIHLFAAEAAAQVPDTSEVERRLAMSDPDLARDLGWKVRIRAYRAASAPQRGARAAEAAAAVLPQAADRADAWARVGELSLAAGDTTAAVEALRRAMEASPGSLGAVDAARVLSALPGASAEDRLRIGRVFLRHGNRQRGIAGLRAYLEAGLGTPADRAGLRLDVGRALFESGEYAQAERELVALSGAAGVPGGIAAEALYWAGRAQYRQGRTRDGRRTLESIPGRFPGERAAARALYLVGDLRQDAGDTTEAARLYRAAVSAVPDLYESGLAVMRLGGLAFLAGDHAAASAVYDDYLRAFPNGRRAEQARYWSARARLELGDREGARRLLRELRELDPISWYGLRAAELLGQGFWDFPLEDAPPPSDSARGSIAQAIGRVDLLEEVGRSDAVDHEVARVRRSLSGQTELLYELAEALNARGHTITGIGIGWDLHRREGRWNLRLLTIVYPFPFREMILAEAAERDLDPYLVAGLIRRESIFKPAIRSPAGAVGLMQVMPPTGASLAREAGIEDYDARVLTQPEINLHLGARFLRDLMRRYDGRLAPVLAAYNAGPHRVTGWRDFPEFVDDELFAERIPYAETRDYVKIVQSHARIYEALYGGAAGLPGG